jgi:hypothetical protein
MGTFAKDILSLCPMSGTDKLTFLALTGALLVAAPSLYADGPAVQPPSPDAVATSQALFVEGRRLVAEGKFAEGCAKLEESQRLDPAPGTELNLGDCYAKSGKLASALIAFHEAATSAQRTGRIQWSEQARDRARELEPQVPHLTIVADDLSPSLELRRDGEALVPSTVGSPVPVDPGVHEITATAPGHRRWSTRVQVGASEHVVLYVPGLVEDAPPPAPAPSKPVIARHALPALAAPEHVGSVQRTLGITVGVVGAAWIVAGAAFGVTAIVDNKNAATRCPASPRCTDPSAITLTNDARRAADASTAAFIAGGSLLGAAAALFLTAPSAPLRLSFGTGPADARVTLVGQF